jgi:hypothetical protein
MKSVVRSLLLLLFALSCVFASVLTRADSSVTLAWDPSPDPGISNYNLYYGPSSGTVTNEVSVGLNTSGTISNLTAGTTYFVYVTAVNSSGTESAPSNYLTYQVSSGPQLAPVSDQTVVAGSLLQLTLTATEPSAVSPVFTYSLVSGPAGAAVDPATGVFTWTPTSTQASSTNSVTVQAVDNSSPPLSATTTFMVVVIQPNHPPVLAAIPDQTVVLGSTLTLQVSATDPDPGNTLIYAMVYGPTGASVNPSTGLFSWTPTQVTVPSTNSVTIQVTDNGVPMMSASQSFNIMVTGPNTAPILAAIPNLVGSVGSPISWPLSATDSDLPAQTLSYSLVSGPAGATVNAASGLFSWTPTQASSGVGVTVQVTDSGNPPLSSKQSFTVVVAAANTPPTFPAVPNQTVTAGNPLTVQFSAADSNIPVQTLTFSLGSGPVGAAVSPSGLFSWTPAPSQITSTNAVTVQVTDSGNPPLSASQTFSIIVKPSNTAPVLASVGGQTVLAGTPLTIQLSATDSDLPAQTLTFSLVTGPSGATVTPTGLLSWTPNTSQAPSTNLVTVKVTDSGTPSLSNSKSFNVVVKANTAPTLAAIPDQTIPEQQPFSLKLSAQDPNPGQTLTYSLVSGPAGLSVNPATGMLTWTPTEAQGPSTNRVTVQVTDSGTPSLSSNQTFTIVVQEVNTAPVIQPIPDQFFSAGQTVMLAVTATDADIPANTLTYSLVSGPSGASVDPHTGVFTWRLFKSVSASTNLVTVMVTDNGTPPLSAKTSFNIIVSGKRNGTAQSFKVTNLETVSWVAELDGNRSVRFNYPLAPNRQSGQWINYLEASEDLINWVTLGVVSDLTELHDTNAAGTQKRFYRIRSEQADPAQTVDAGTISAQ